MRHVTTARLAWTTYGQVVIWVGRWEIRERIPRQVGASLDKMETQGSIGPRRMEREEDLMNVLAPERSEEEAETMTIKPRTTTEVVTRFLSRSERDP